MTQPELIAELQEMHAFLASLHDETDGTLLSKRLSILSAYLARSGEMYSEAQYILDAARGVHSELLDGLNATRFREVLNSKTAKERRLLALCDRLNSTLTHTIEATRSQISYCKAVASGQGTY